MTDPTDTPVATNPYPIALTREALVAAEACPGGLAAFDALCPTGVLTITDAYAHSALLGTALAAHEDWAVDSYLLPPVCVQGPDHARVVAGYRGHAVAGYRGHATAGMHGHATAGDYGHATAGYGGRATAGHGGHATAGMHGHAVAGYGGRATAGHGGHATAGAHGLAIAGDGGHATAGAHGRAIAGEGGTLRLAYWAWGRTLRLATAYVGEDGIEPNVAYRVGDDGRVVRV